ncbi:uncharacterized protein [Littorina saxatilis]|uniref:Uncharacterized protein n=1 Tax=Littorina saxatilis TaxID=31220 RepID=A0AAN9G510_9CAEN
MFVVSELNFKDYLNQPDYAKLTGKLPKPANLPKEQRHLGKQGDFDILVIHRKHGILVGEIKSVGRTEASRADSEVVKKIKDGVKHLDKCEVQARHMVSDIAPGLTVRKTLFLPYVSRAQLQRILDDENNAKLQQTLCQSLCAATTAEAIDLCCCSDQLSQPASYWDVTPAVLSQLSTWWQHRMACSVDTLLTDDLYLDIVARIVGPATACSVHCNTPARVAVRTEGEAVSELGWRLALLVLTLQQIDLLNRNPPRVCILGPPGTGKTVVLVLQGLRWLLEGHDVQVVSARNVNWAIGRVITEQLRLSLQMSLSADQTPSTTPGEVTYYQYDFRERGEDVEKALTELTACVKDGQLHLLMDEATLSKSDEEHRRLVTELTHRVPHVFIWSTGIMCTDVPAELQSENFTVPLRCAPAILREVQPGFSMFMGVVDNYSIRDGVPAPGDGLRVIKLIHEGIAHTGRWPVDCTQCGEDIATELRRLGVGTGANLVKNSPEPLSYRDVFVLTRSPHLQDDVTDDAGNVVSPAIGVVHGLRKAGLPVCVLEEQRMVRDKDKWERDLRDVAMAATDRVTVAHFRYVTGMERRVVAVVPGKAEGADEMDSDLMTDAEDRMYSASRCTTQLILVEVPGKALTSGLDRKFGSAGGPDQPKKRHEEQKKDTTGVSWVKKKGFLL